jgi:hypothetical protein
MDIKQGISPLLKDLIRDNPTYPFPISTIRNELTQLLISQEEFDYFMWAAYRKIKKQHSDLVAKIFITTAEVVLDLHNKDIHEIDYTTYHDLMEQFYNTLSTLKITRVDKGSPDGELLTAMM